MMHSKINCFALAATLFAATVCLAGKNDRRLDIYWVDVEGGAATMVITPAGESILIDTGNPGRRDPDRIAKVAAVAGIRQIDHLITTHYHRDHFGGAAALSKILPIKTVYDNGVFENMPNDPGKEYFNFKAGRRQVINPGDALSLQQPQDEGSPTVQFTCLGTRQTFVKSATAAANDANCARHKPKDRDGSDNANSVVMLLEYGNFRFYDGGDLTWNQEMRLVCPKNLVGKVDVYQVTHHGLDSSNNPVVLSSLQPHVAIMNNGVTKGCMPEVFANLTEAKSLKAVYQVHKNLRPDGVMNNVPDDFIANTERDCEGHYIKLSVDPSGASYTVSIPAHDHQRTYKTTKK